MINSFQDAKRLLLTAEKAFNDKAYQQSAEIVEDVARYAAYQSDGLTAGRKPNSHKLLNKPSAASRFAPTNAFGKKPAPLWTYSEINYGISCNLPHMRRKNECKCRPMPSLRRDRILQICSPHPRSRLQAVQALRGYGTRLAI